jgi:hypothetical protein
MLMNHKYLRLMEIKCLATTKKVFGLEIQLADKYQSYLEFGRNIIAFIGR